MKSKFTLCCVAFTLAFTIVFAACNSKTAVYVDPAGKTHAAVLDESGNTIVNDEGYIIVYQTEENGDIVTNESGVAQTQGSAFPNSIQSGGTVQTMTYNVELPIGWGVDEKNTEKYTKALSTEEVTVTVLKDTTVDVAYQKLVDFCDQFAASSEKSTTGKFSYTVGTMDYVAAGAQAKTVEYKAEVFDEGTETTYSIFFENAGNVYKLVYEARDNDYSLESFAKFYTAITYKNVLYY